MVPRLTRRADAENHSASYDPATREMASYLADKVALVLQDRAGAAHPPRPHPDPADGWAIAMSVETLGEALDAGWRIHIRCG
jgi:hypothetical protein